MDQPGAQSFRAVLGIGRFRRFFASRAVSLVGDSVVATALAISVTEQKASAIWLGGLLAAAILPKVAFLALGGMAADRFAKLRLMMISSVACGLAQLATTLVFLTHSSLWWAMTCQVCYGACAAVSYPATFSYLPRCVGPESLGAANSLLSAWTGIAAIAGPAITAGFAAIGHPALALALDGISFLLGAILLIGLPGGGPSPVSRPSGGSAALREGWSALRALPWLMRMTVVDSLLLLVVIGPFMVIAPGLVERQARDGWALLMLVFAVGQLLGSLAAGHAAPRRPILAASVGLLAVGLPPLFLAAGAGLAPLSVAEILAGAAVSAYGVLVNTAVQQWATPEHLAKVGALTSLGSFAFLPLGYVLAPSLAVIVGPRPFLWAGAIWTLFSVALLIAGRQLREFTGAPERETQPPVPSATGSQ